MDQCSSANPHVAIARQAATVTVIEDVVTGIIQRFLFRRTAHHQAGGPHLELPALIRAAVSLSSASARLVNTLSAYLSANRDPVAELPAFMMGGQGVWRGLA